jgi:pyrroloquinoline quinone (PQQ) biosynthesis protein C
MGTGFGVKREAMLGLADGDQALLRDVQSLNDWLWHINTKGSLAEAVAATSFAVEGIAGDIARKVTDGFQHYRNETGVDLSPKTYRWMREHAHYDDEHPKIALQIVERYATTERIQKRVMFAAKRSLELLDHALITAYQAYALPKSSGSSFEEKSRTTDRRAEQALIDFPDRRFAGRRGLLARMAA